MNNKNQSNHNQMKKIIAPAFAFMMAALCLSFTPAEQGVYVQLHPGNNKKIVIQILPDKTYADVVAHVNFYSSDNKRVAQQAFSLSDEKDRYVRKGKCTTRVFKFSIDKAVARVTIDHVNEGAGKDNSGGTKLNLAVSQQPLEPIEK
jgi:hypothetical protein